MKNSITVAAPLLFLGATSATASTTDRPNIIFFIVDDMGVMDTSLPFLTNCNGEAVKYGLNAFYRTPNMEKLAQSGIRFSTFYAQNVSSPSRVSLLTGQNSTRHGVTNWINAESNNRGEFGPSNWNWEGVTTETKSLQSALQGVGYRTIHVGKAHLAPIGKVGEFPENVGFDVNVAGSAIGEPGSYFAEDGYGNINGFKIRAVKGLEKYHGGDTFLSEALTIEANKQIEEAVKSDTPFFLHMSHYALHAINGKFPLDPRFADNYTDSGYPEIAVQFATLVEGMDKSLGDMVAKLKELGVAENTLILFVGDNGSDSRLGDPLGYSSSSPLRGMKATEYEGGVRVPFIASWAEVDNKSSVQKRLPIKSGAIQLQAGTIMDLYPTVLSLVGLDPAHVVDGFDLKTQLSNKYNKGRSNRVLMHFPHGHRGSYFTSFIDDDRWKLVYYYEPRTNTPYAKLYDLNNDPFETTDLSRVEFGRCNAMIVKMSQQLEAEHASYPQTKAGETLKPRSLTNKKD